MHDDIIMKCILICGLPGSGKTTLAKELQQHLDADWYNADLVREEANDWDFSDEGRHRQMNRMKLLCAESLGNGKYVIADFVCPTKDLREEFNPDFIVWMDTIDEGRFEDTNKIFEPVDSTEIDVIITEYEWWNTLYIKQWAEEIKRRIING